MKLAVRLILAIAVIVLGLWLWSVIFPSPEKVIRQHLDKTARLASFQANESGIARMGNLVGFSNCFSEDAEVQFEMPSGGRQTLSGREEITRTAGGARNLGVNLQVEFLDVSVRVAPDNETANVDLVARAKIAGDGEFFVQEVKLKMKKFGRSWLITRAETAKTLN